MPALKVAVLAAVLAGLAQWIGHIPAAIIDAATFVGCLIYLCSKIVTPGVRWLRRAGHTYDVLEHLPETLARLDERLDRLEGIQQEIAEPVHGIARELDVHHGDPHPELPPHRHTIPE